MEEAKFKFPETFCSQCGGAFGPGDHGFSHCDSHPGPVRDRLYAAASDLRIALKQLSFAAQTTGGTAGRDDALVEAIGQAEAALAKAEVGQ